MTAAATSAPPVPTIDRDGPNWLAKRRLTRQLRLRDETSARLAELDNMADPQPGGRPDQRRLAAAQLVRLSRRQRTDEDGDRVQRQRDGRPSGGWCVSGRCNRAGWRRPVESADASGPARLGPHLEHTLRDRARTEPLDACSCGSHTACTRPHTVERPSSPNRTPSSGTPSPQCRRRRDRSRRPLPELERRLLSDCSQTRAESLWRAAPPREVAEPQRGGRLIADQRLWSTRLVQVCHANEPSEQVAGARSNREIAAHPDLNRILTAGMRGVLPASTFGQHPSSPEGTPV